MTNSIPNERLKWNKVIQIKSPFYLNQKKHPEWKGDRVQFNIRIPKEMKERLNEARGTTPIGDYLIMIIENHFNSNS
jgi:hypothetical protein